MHPEILRVTADIETRSGELRDDYLAMIDDMGANPIDRSRLSCGNLAHGFAACSPGEKSVIKMMDSANVGIVTAYNDMLSAHQPYADFPELIKSAVRSTGSTAQVAGGVPAMCDGVTQGQDGMELSLFSRDNIAQGTQGSGLKSLFSFFSSLPSSTR